LKERQKKEQGRNKSEQRRKGFRRVHLPLQKQRYRAMMVS